MKKMLFYLLLIALFLMPSKIVFAGSIAPSTSSISVQQGNSTSFSVVASNAVGDVIVSSSNPGVATVSPGTWKTGMIGAGETLSGTFTVTGVSVGTATITIVIDGYAFDNGGYDVSGTRTITVNVTAPPPPPEPQPSTPTPTPTPNTPTIPTGPADNRSTNTNLSSLTIAGKKVTPLDNIYTLEVANYLERVSIEAKASDSKAKVSGTGSKDLKVGENTFNIVVTAERGNTKTYVVKIVRKEYNTLSDVDEAIKENKETEARIEEKDKLTKDLLDKIIKDKKKVSLVKMSNDNKRIIYSFILDGSKIKSGDEFNPNVLTVIDDNVAMEEALNYADGIYLDFTKCGDVPKGAVLRYFVGDKYQDNDKVNLYVYDKTSIKQIKENLVVKDGYIEFEISNSLKHFISKSKVINAENTDINIWFIISIILGGVVLVLMGLLLFVKMRKTNVVDKNCVSKIDKRSNHDVDVEKTIKLEKKSLKDHDVPEITEIVEDDETIL